MRKSFNQNVWRLSAKDEALGFLTAWRWSFFCWRYLPRTGMASDGCGVTVLTRAPLLGTTKLLQDWLKIWSLSFREAAAEKKFFHLFEPFSLPSFRPCIVCSHLLSSLHGTWEMLLRTSRFRSLVIHRSILPRKIPSEMVSVAISGQGDVAVKTNEPA